jgi:hypothetical protein
MYLHYEHKKISRRLTLPSMLDAAVLASSLLVKLTKPKPLDLPDSLSVITRAAAWNISFSEQGNDKLSNDMTADQIDQNIELIACTHIGFSYEGTYYWPTFSNFTKAAERIFQRLVVSGPGKT